MMHFFHLTLLQMQFHKGNASSQDKATAFDQQLLCVPPFFYAFDSSLRISGCFLQHANLGGLLLLISLEIGKETIKNFNLTSVSLSVFGHGNYQRGFFPASVQNGLLKSLGAQSPQRESPFAWKLFGVQRDQYFAVTAVDTTIQYSLIQNLTYMG